MGFLDTILGMFGIGQPTVEASADASNLELGSLVTVTITLTGGNREMPLTALIAELKKEYKLSEGGTTWDTLAEEKVLFGDQALASGETVSTTITLQVPKDADPTGGDIKHKIVCSADVPGWDPSKDIEVTITGDTAPMAAEDFTEYHVIPEERTFRHSSVRGDFRVYPVPDGVVTGWNKSGSIGRNADGSERWRSRFGRTLAISDDGSTLFAANNNKQVALIDPVSGDEKKVIDVGDWVNNIVPLSNGGAAFNVTEKVVIVDAEGAVTREITSIGADGEPYLGSMCAGGDDTVVVIDSNARLLVRLDTATGDVKESTQLNFYPSDVYNVGGKLLLDSGDDIAFADETLKVGKKFDPPGRKGVRYLGQQEHSSTHFKCNARLSPNGQRILLNDQSGLLWLLDSKGDPLRTWNRSDLPYVEDTGWTGDDTFVAITNDGRSHAVSATTGAVSWTQQDVT
jgi:hypothetical protein